MSSVTFEENSQLASIGASAFSNASSLTSIIIPANVTTIGELAFYQATNLSSVIFEEKSQLISIGASAFYYTSLNSINIPASVTTIGEQAFEGATKIETVTFGSNSKLISIGQYAFQGMSLVTSITIPASVTSIGPAAFANASVLTKFEVDPANNHYKEISGILFNSNETALIQYPSGKSITDYKIPLGVTSIGESAFQGASALTSVTIPSSVAVIGADAFMDSGLSYVYTSITINNTDWDDNGDNTIGGKSGITVIFTRFTSANYTNADSPAVFTIPDIFTDIGDAAFNDVSALTSITIPNSVTTIGNSAFQGATSLTTVIFEENSQLTSIGDQAFYNTSALTTINIPASVTTIGDNAFFNARALTSIKIPANITTIGTGMFQDARALATVIFEPDSSLNTIGANAFAQASALTEITIPEGVTSIGASAFQGASALTSITIPEGVTSIGDQTFQGASALTSITIPDGVISIGDQTFQGASALTSITIPEGVTNIGFGAFQGVSALTSIIIPKGVTSIRKYTFYQATSLTTVTFEPDSSLNTIGDSAFYGATALTEINIPASVKSIGASAFLSATALTEINIPEGVTSIGDQTFLSASALTSINIPASVTAIGTSAFRGATSLTTVTFEPDSSLKSIGEDVFGNALALTNIIIPKGVTSIGNYAFSDATSLTTITFEPDSSLKSIGYGAFQGASALSSITIPEGVTSIGDQTFRSASALTSIIIPKGVASIGEYTFYQATSLTTVTFEPDSSLKSIGDSAFAQASALTSIKIPASVTILGNNVFSSATSLTTVTFEPDSSLNSIGEGAFGNASALTSIIIPEGVTSIGLGAFQSVSALTTIIIPKGVTSIGTNTFQGATSLTTVTFEPDSSLNTIGDSAFAQASRLTSIKIPASVTIIGKRTFQDATSLSSVTFVEGSQLTKIGASAFQGASALSSITIPEGVTSIGEPGVYNLTSNAFVNTGLTTIKMSVYKIGSGNGFPSAKGITTEYNTIKPVNIQTYQLFSGRGELNEDTVSTLLAEVAIIEGYNSIGENAFNMSGILEEVIFNDDNITNIKRLGFYQCGKLNTIILPPYLTEIGDSAFGKTALTNIVIPKSVMTLGVGIFQSISTLISVLFKEGSQLTYISDSLFQNNTSLEIINIPESVIIIGSRAFAGTSSLKYINIPSSVLSIGNEAFYENELINVRLPIHLLDLAKSDNIFRMSWSNTYVKNYYLYNGLRNIVKFIIEQDFQLHGKYTLKDEWADRSKFNLRTGNPPELVDIVYQYWENNGFLSYAPSTWQYYEYGEGIKELDDAIAQLTKYGTKFNFYRQLVPSNGSIGDNELSQLYNYEHSLTMAGIIKQSDVPSLEVTILEQPGEEISITTLKKTFISSLVIPKTDENTLRTAFQYCIHLRAVTFSNSFSATTIPDSTFTGCINLINISIPTIVESIGSRCFADCNNLIGSFNTNMLDLQSITTIGSYAFANCYSLLNVNINQQKLTSIGQSVFTSCKKLINILLPDNSSYTEIATDTFSYCTSLNTMDFPSHIKTIGDSSFKGCTMLNNISLMSGLINIEDQAFYDCSSLLIVNMPSSLQTLGTSVFINCSSLSIVTLSNVFLQQQIESFNVSYSNTEWKDSIFGPTSQVKLEYYYIFAPIDSTSTILTKIDVFYWMNKWKLTDIYTVGLFNAYVDNKVTIIDVGAFRSCKTLATISIGINVKEIKPNVFEGCDNLQNFYIGSNIKSLSNNALTSIGDSVFNGCNISSIIIPNTVVKLGKWVFYNATNLKEIIFYPGTKIETIDDYAFANCTSLQLLRIPNTVKQINKNAFMNCINLNNVILPQTLEIIGESAFESCNNITTIHIPNSVTEIGDNAFRNVNIPTTSIVSIPSIFKKNINSIFNYQKYTGTIEIYKNIYDTNIKLYNYYTWLKQAFGVVNNSSMGSQNHTLDSLVDSGYFGSNVYNNETMVQEFGGDVQAKAAAKSYMAINSSNGSSNADTNINNTYFKLKNSLMRLDSIEPEYAYISSEIFDYHYYIQTDSNILTREQVAKDMSGVTLPFTASLANNITVIEPYVFEGYKLETIELNNVLTDICNNAFKGVPLSGVLVIPSSVKHIGDGAFEDCSGIRSIIFPSNGSLKTIGERAFYGCNISTIYIPPYVEYIGHNAFTGGNSLTTVTFNINTNIPQYKNSNYFNSNLTMVSYEYEIYIYPTLNNNGKYEISATDVNNYIGNFSGNFTAVINHKNDSQTDKIIITDEAFMNTNIYRIHDVRNLITEIGEQAFANTALTSANIGSSVDVIGKKAFFNCSHLIRVKLPSKHFSKCNNEYFTSNQNIVYMYYCVLKANTNNILTEFEVFNQLGVDDTFLSTIAITFDSNVFIIGKDAFNGNSYISQIIIPNTVVLIDDYAFANCSDLNSIRCNSDSILETIGKYAFFNCSKLDTVRLPLSLLNIGHGAFLSCDSLWSVTLSKIFDYGYFVQNNIYFESTRMINESWKSNDQWNAGGTFFTFNFETNKGKGYTYSWAKSDYMSKQRAIQANKVAAHNKVISKWNKFGEDVAIFAITILVSVATDGIMSAGTSAISSAVYGDTEIVVDTAAKSAAQALADKEEANTALLYGGQYANGIIGQAENGFQRSIAQSRKTFTTDIISKAAGQLAGTYISTPVLDDIQSGIISKQYISTSSSDDNNNHQPNTNTNKTYGSMSIIYNNNNIQNKASINTNHSEGSWIIETTINNGNSGINHDNIKDEYKKLISTNINTILTNNTIYDINVEIVHALETHDYELHKYIIRAIITNMDWDTVTEDHKSSFNNTINSNLSNLLNIDPTNISTIESIESIESIISNICFPKNTPIKTDQGIINIEKINPKIHTINNNSIVALTKSISLEKYLVFFKQDALGINYPVKDTIISQEHKILYNGKMIKADILLGKYPGIYKIKYNGDILYNILMDNYSVMNVNNLTCETLDPNSIIGKLYKKYNGISDKNKKKIIKQINDYTIKMDKTTKPANNLKQLFFTK